ncbi:monocarboxylate transporter 10-like [Montipora capricornis]|uniref:monocarboxylate transporter 10-like n=1 Tax=Montipora capricornis TaxID=246305 RepID=UPI0035F1F9C5
MVCCKKKSMDEKPEIIVPFPDGGWGWFVCMATFTTQFIVLGIMNNFGVIYVELLAEFKIGKADAAVVGSITYGMMFLLGPLATSLCQKLGCRVTTMIGCVIAASGCLLGSIATNIYLMDLTYGFLFGVGASMCYFPSVVILGQYFSKRLSLANGITSSGSGVGSLCMGPVLQKLIQQFGLRTTMKVSAGMLSCVVLCALIYRPINTGFLSSHKEPVGEKKSRFAFLKSFRDLFKNKAYILWCASLALWMLGYFVPFVHLVSLAIEEGIDPFKATLLIGIMSIASTFGRLIFGKMADHPKVNRLYLYQISFLMIGISNTLCPVLTSYPGLVIYASMFGFFEGCYVLLAPVLTGDIVGRDKMAHGVGVLFALKSVPLTVGPVIAGKIYQAFNSYQVAFYISGAVPTAAACMMFGIPFLMPDREEDDKCRVVLADESGFDEKATYFDEKRTISEKDLQWSNGFYTGLPEVIIEEPEDDGRPMSFHSMGSNGHHLSSLSVHSNKNKLGLSTNSISNVRETCLVSVDTINVRRSRLLQLKGELSSSVFSLVRRYMDMPKEVAASEFGSIACIPQHIANNPQQPAPLGNENCVFVGKETVV